MKNNNKKKKVKKKRVLRDVLQRSLAIIKKIYIYIHIFKYPAYNLS